MVVVFAVVHDVCVCWIGMVVVFSARPCGWYGDDHWHLLEHSQSDVNKRHLASENSYFSHNMVNFIYKQFMI